MRNTGTEYMNGERTPKVLPEMAELLPPLTDEQLSLLEADILKNGCYAPIIVNEDLVIVDGHNRYQICEKHGLPYRLAVFSFEDLLEAKQWALDTQKSRRNLTINELCKIAMKLRPEVEARAEAKLHLASGGDRRSDEFKNQGSATLPNLDMPKNTGIDTRKELAKSVGVGERTMGKAMKIEDEAPQAVKDAVDSGDITIHQGYNLTRELEDMDLPDEEQEAAAKEAVEREIARKRENRLKKINEKTKIAKSFNTAFEKAIILEPSVENIRTWIAQSGILCEQMDRVISEAKKISETFAVIADVVENTIRPEDWRWKNEAEANESEVSGECEDEDSLGTEESCEDLDGEDA